MSCDSWIDITTASQLCQVARQVFMRKLERFTCRQVPNPNGGRGGFKYEIALDSLPKEAQERYWENVRLAQAVEAAKPKRGRPSKAAIRKAEAEAEEVKANEEYLAAPNWQKNAVDNRLYIVEQTMQLGQKGIEQWLLEHGENVSVATVYRWRKAYLQGGKNALFTGYGNRKGESIIPDDVFEVFMSCYMTEGKVSTRAAYLAAIGHLRKNYQCDKLPSLQAFEYRCRREIDESARYFARYGQSAWNRKYGRSITRDYSKITCGECVFSDHMQLDLMVSLPDGTTCRPWLTAWSDFKSRKILGWDLHAAAPNSDHIFTSFRSMAANFGLPGTIYIDNGKDYRCKDFAGGRVRCDVDEKYTTSLMSDLGIEVHYALPYNAQSKNIERRFRDFHNYFERMLEGYTGSTIPKRPEVLKKQLKTGKILPLEQASQLLNKFITEILNKMPFGKGAIFANLSPNELWQADNPVLRRADPKSLAVFCQRSSRLVTIGRNGVKDPDLDAVYWAEEFVSMKGKRVYLRRDLSNYAEAWVYGTNDELICLAKLAESIHPLAADEVSKEALKERTAQKRREIKAVKAAAKVPTIAAADKMNLLQAGVAALNQERGWEEKPQNNVITVQRTPLDDRVRQMEELRREATTNTPIYPILTPPVKPKKKIYLTRTQRDLDQNKGGN